MDVTLPHHVVEDILERLPVKTLRKFKCVCSTWRSTIDSQRFKDRHMIHGQLLEDPDILLLGRWDPPSLSKNASLMTLTFDSSTMPFSFKIQTIPGKANFYKVTQSHSKSLKVVTVYDSNMEATGLVLYDMTQSERTFANFCLSFKNRETPTAYFPSLITI
ncbi:T15D22.6 [Arabidopsis thaliana]|uniref:F-box protein At1g15015 n=2 Tax=Arabidopsis thaliana TaxID=3702 RepID=FB9_ARATH|nr:F-box family protein [Arabidopsis thaliana]Q9M9Q4.1 RecName: Full=F-box protein At1g15015 [Arabidopsis thaliana]AAF31024.1 T15D22.6 [Arabidopsis thaliana]ABF59410.1 unknown protein [Arabidopsis thaliana]AEE29254.1 F-box family protein [Arabidopsis thaliana]|eukprot:NP_001117291.1 F-box family protein [Arabidopsis thaliana]